MKTVSRNTIAPRAKTPKPVLLSPKYLQFARQNCCNYSVSGPGKITNYCFLSPKETAGVCSLALGKPCEWFADAVVPLNRELQAEWAKLPQTFHTCQQCGGRFKSLSQNKPLCPACTEAVPTMVPVVTRNGCLFIKCGCGKEFEITRSGERLCPDCATGKSGNATSPPMAPKTNRPTLQCACGRAFTPTGNRQTRCPDCAAKARTESYRVSKRKTRARGSGVHS